MRSPESTPPTPIRPGWHETDVAGVLRRSTTPSEDSRGSFTELWRASWTEVATTAPVRFVQANLSRSRADVLRGMHVHRRQDDLWMVIEGRVVAATTDLRPMVAAHRSAAAPVAGPRAAPASQVLELSTGDALYIPRLVAHGFLALGEMALVYLVSHEYDGTDELGFAWDDPDAAIPWPSRTPIVSDRDASSPSLKDAVATLAAD